jgi:hypothetical protein
MLLWNIPVVLIAFLLFILRIFDIVKVNEIFYLGIGLLCIGVIVIGFDFVTS